MRRHALIALMLLPHVVAQAQATRSAVETVFVGPTAIRIPTLPDFAGPDYFGTDIKRHIETGFFGGRIFLTGFISEADLNSKNQRPRRYAIVYTVAEASNQELSIVDFASTRDYLRRTYRQRIERSSSILQSQADSQLGQLLPGDTTPTPRLKADQLHPVGGISETGISISSSEVHSYQLLQTPNSHLSIVSTTTTMLIRQRLLFLAVFSDYEHPEDAHWTENTSKAWLGAIVRANRDP